MAYHKDRDYLGYPRDRPSTTRLQDCVREAKQYQISLVQVLHDIWPPSARSYYPLSISQPPLNHRRCAVYKSELQLSILFPGAKLPRCG